MSRHPGAAVQKVQMLMASFSVNAAAGLPPRGVVQVFGYDRTFVVVERRIGASSPEDEIIAGIAKTIKWHFIIIINRIHLL